MILDTNKKGRIIINLGCGNTRLPGSIGVDSIRLDGFVDVVQNLDIFPYPFADNSVDEVWLIFVLEHLENPLKVLEEIYRILKPEGKVFIRVPHFSSVYCWGELTHKRAFFYGFWEVFTQDGSRSYYSKARFKVIESRLKYFLTWPSVKWHISDNWQPHWEKYFLIGGLIKVLVSVVQFFIDLSPRFFERFWCYYVGGAAEVNCVLQADK